MNENGEYQTAKFSDAKENYRVITKSITVKLTREMIINDDLRAFTRIPQLFGTAAKCMESDAVYDLITSNGAILPDFVQALADEEMRRIAKRQKMFWLKRMWTYLVVRFYQINKKPGYKRPIFEVP